MGGAHPAFGSFDFNTFLAGLTPAATIAARHTVGLADPITADDVTEPLQDGLPQTLEQVIERYGHRYFKLKLSGQVEADLQRLHAIAAVLDRTGLDYQVTLDGNEQFVDSDTLSAWAHRLRTSPRRNRSLTMSTARSILSQSSSPVYLTSIIGRLLIPAL